MSKNENRIVIRADIFDLIYDMAMNDAMNRVSEKDEKEAVYNELKDTVKLFAENVLNGKVSDYDATMEGISQEFINVHKYFTFGKLQKLINMTMKYLYIRYYDDIKVNKRFNICDAPMDGIMRRFVYDSYCIVKDKHQKPKFKRNGAWSKIEKAEGDYKNYQNAIDSIINSKKLGINRIEFDYIYWGDAKRWENDGDDRMSKLENLWKNIEEV